VRRVLTSPQVPADLALPAGGVDHLILEREDYQGEYTARLVCRHPPELPVGARESCRPQP
jgi:hypothetical protein